MDPFPPLNPTAREVENSLKKERNKSQKKHSEMSVAALAAVKRPHEWADSPMGEFSPTCRAQQKRFRLSMSPPRSSSSFQAPSSPLFHKESAASRIPHNPDSHFNVAVPHGMPACQIWPNASPPCRLALPCASRLRLLPGQSAREWDLYTLLWSCLFSACLFARACAFGHACLVCFRSIGVVRSPSHPFRKLVHFQQQTAPFERHLDPKMVKRARTRYREEVENSSSPYFRLPSPQKKEQEVLFSLDQVWILWRRSLRERGLCLQDS